MNKDNFTKFSSGIVGASLLAGIIVAWAVMLLPAHSTAIAPGNGQAVLRGTSNVSLKGDRLAGVHSKLGGAAATRDADSMGKGVANMPVGCDPAFSITIQYGNFVVRCTT